MRAYMHVREPVSLTHTPARAREPLGFSACGRARARVWSARGMVCEGVRFFARVVVCVCVCVCVRARRARARAQPVSSTPPPRLHPVGPPFAARPAIPGRARARLSRAALSEPQLLMYGPKKL